MPAPAPPAKPKRARAAPASPARAFGRSLADFGELFPAEKTLLECCRSGEQAVIGEERPDEETDANRVRAGFVRFLVLGGDEGVPIHEHGVHLEGAWVAGALDLQAASAEHRLALLMCTIEAIEAFHSRLKALSLDESRLLGDFTGWGLYCEGSLFLRGCEASGRVTLIGATIAGDLDCTGGHFDNGENYALSCDRIALGGNLMLSECTMTGGACLADARIGGNLECSRARLDGGDRNALFCDRMRVSAGVTLAAGFHATGQVSLLGAAIEGDLQFGRGRFQNSGGIALSCQDMKVGGALFFRDVTAIDGVVLLAGARADSLTDDIASWTHARGLIVLDGFTYGQLVDAPTDAAARITWLDLQWPDHLKAEFKPQPWEQLIAILRAMGHPEAARSLAIAKQDRLRRAGKVVRGARPLHWLYGFLVGYGYRPMRLLATTASVWLICFLAYWAAANPAWFGAETHLLAPPPSSEPGHAAPAPDYRNFVPLIYSADVLLPVVDLGYKDEWQPVVADRAGNPLFWGQLLRFLYWFEIAFGWVAGLLLVGVLGNLIKKD